MAPHSSTTAWKIPWMEEPGSLQSMGSLRVGHDWMTSLSLFILIHWRRKWQPTSIFLPGESQWWGSLVGCHLWGHTESDTTERLHFHFPLSTFMHWRRKWQPTPVLLPGESQGREPGGLPSMGSRRVGHDWSDLAAAAAAKGAIVTGMCSEFFIPTSIKVPCFKYDILKYVFEWGKQ